MQHPEKWRETCDPFSLRIPEFELQRGLGYPHAGNDVFHVEGMHRGSLCRAYLKVARHPEADMANEVRILRQLPQGMAPEVLAGSQAYLLTREVPGQRLSMILAQSGSTDAGAYMPAYGAALAKLHSLRMDCGPARHRRFQDMPGEAYFEEYGLQGLRMFLMENPPTGATQCFVHGDFHYANLLWQDHAISAVLDFELAGHGIREFDMAWALLLRPGQKFLATIPEIESFLNAYGGGFSMQAFCHYYVLSAAHFYAMGDAAYRADLLKIANEVMHLCREGGE